MQDGFRKHVFHGPAGPRVNQKEDCIMKKNNKVMFMLAAGVIGASLYAEEVNKPAEPAAPEAPAEAEAAAPVDLWAGVPDVLAEVNGKAVTRQEVADFLTSQMPDGKLPPMVNAEMIKMILPGLVKSYVDRPLLEAEVEKAGIKASPELVKQQLADDLKSAPREQQEMFKQQLAITGKTLESYIDELADNPQMQQQIAFDKFLKENVLKDITVTPEEARSFYDSHKEEFKIPADSPDTVRASHILVKVDAKASEADRKAAREKAQKLLDQVRMNPAEFEAVAQASSDCPSKANGGSLGAFTKGQMVPEFEKAAFDLKPETIADELVETQFGYHIVRRDAVQQGGYEPFEPNKEAIENMLRAQKSQEAVMAYIAGLEKAADVKFMIPMPEMTK